MSTSAAQDVIDRLSSSPTVDVVFVSTSPLNGAYPGGFARRHSDFADAVARRLRTHVLHVVPPRMPLGVFDEFPPPASVGATTVVIDDDGRHPRLPRQSVGRALRWPGPNLVVPLTPNVAHLALSAERATVVLEEAWERALPPTARGRAERLRCALLYRGLARARHPVVAITDREADYFRRRMANPVVAIPYGADPRWFVDHRPADGGADVLVVGALNRPEQRVEGFVRALRSGGSTRDATCVIVGAKARPGIASLADENTAVVGYVSDVRAHLATARVVAIPTFIDVGIKTTLLQAWAAGTPVVTSREVLGAVPDGAGAAIGVSSLSEMAGAVGALLADRSRAEALGAAGRALVVRAFDPERTSGAFAELVTTTLGRRPAGTP
jgi:phosphatidylinositol alpha-1,6-mannosyltransferase